MNAFLHVIAHGLGVSAVFTLITGVLNAHFDWELGLGIGGFDIELPNDFPTVVALSVCLVLLAALCWGLAERRRIWEWIATHKSLSVGGLAGAVGLSFGFAMWLAGGALGLAVERQDEAEVRRLLAGHQYASSELSDHLYQALKREDLGIAQALLEAGADLDRTSGEFETPLLGAAVVWFPARSVEWLLKQGANANATDNLGRSPALLAVLYRSGNIAGFGDEELARLLGLLKASGADLTLAAKNGDTPASVAADRQLQKVLEVLDETPAQVVEDAGS